MGQKLTDGDFAYRIFDSKVRNGETYFMSLFHGTKGSRTIPLGEWVDADVMDVKNPGTSKYTFKSGWHVTPSFEEAKGYLTKFSSKQSQNYVLAKVQVGGEIRPKPRSLANVWLAEKMKIVEVLGRPSLKEINRNNMNKRVNENAKELMDISPMPNKQDIDEGGNLTAEEAVEKVAARYTDEQKQDIIDSFESGGSRGNRMTALSFLQTTQTEYEVDNKDFRELGWEGIINILKGNMESTNLKEKLKRVIDHLVSETIKRKLSEERTPSEVALDIQKNWKNMSPHARPYVQAMRQLYSVDDMYGYEDGRGIINRFLANASTWRGDTARSIKKELKQMLK